MIIDIDTIAEQVPAWSLTLRIDGTNYVVNELTYADCPAGVGRFEDMTAEQCEDWLDEVFADGPDTSGWTLKKKRDTVQVILAFLREHMTARESAITDAVQKN